MPLQGGIHPPGRRNNDGGLVNRVLESFNSYAGAIVVESKRPAAPQAGSALRADCADCAEAPGVERTG